ncbi:hypothetical protein HWV62_20718 [Athelia sp. TMB]|nr:hypothetical protein HWV62_20718 [Athelia sp. TMB]
MMNAPNFSIQERILASSSQSSSLLKTLSETEYASPAIPPTITSIQTLRDEIAARTRVVHLLKVTLNKERKEHEAYRDSKVTRLAYRLTGKKEKFASKAEKEQQEYEEALQKHYNATQQLDGLKQNLAVAEQKLEELRGVEMLHNDTQKQLEALYESIFQGPTPDFPEEDSAEAAVHPLRAEFAAVQTRLSVESQVVSLLFEAQQIMKRALADMANAHSMSTYDVWGGGVMADMAERDSLSRAESHTSQVSMLVNQARRVQPAVRDIGGVEIAHGNVMGDIMFDNIFNDLAMHDKIKQSQAQLQRTSGNLDMEVVAAREREAAVKAELDGVGRRLEQARQYLQNVRARAFERVAGAMVGNMI